MSFRRAFALLVALLALVAACGGKAKGALMLSMSTDMKVPKDINAIGVSVSANGVLKYSVLGRVTPEGGVILPATLAVVEPEDASTSVRIRVLAFQERKTRVLRDVRTTVPSGRTALLRLRLDFINDASGTGELPPGLLPPAGTSAIVDSGYDSSTFVSTCPPEQTVIDGECKDSFVDPGTLPDFTPALVGNSRGPGCFDVKACFANATPLALTECGATLEGATSQVNLAIVTPDVGECIEPGRCFVPIDEGTGYTLEGNRVRLASFLCRLVTSKSLALYASAGCATKNESVPLCAAPPPGEGEGVCADSPRVVAAVTSAVDAFIAKNGELVDEATAGCAELARQLGATVPESATLVQACDAARSAVSAGPIFVSARDTLTCRVPLVPFAACQSACGGGACDLEANPPRCTGGRLEVACNGECSAEAAASVSCTGNCSASCSGLCDAPPGVACAGRCDGTCQGTTDAKGNCAGTCLGLCFATAPGAPCAGVCEGQCTGDCKAAAASPATCDGRCKADFELLGCRGGRIEGGCAVDAKCDEACRRVAVASMVECDRARSKIMPGGASPGLDRLFRLTRGFGGTSYFTDQASTTTLVGAGCLKDGKKAADLASSLTSATDAVQRASTVLAAFTPGTPPPPPPQVSPVMFTPLSGVYVGPQNIILTVVDPGAMIFYTVDGSNPTPASTMYSGPIDVPVSTTIRAMAAKPGYVNSVVSVATYTIM